MSIGGSLQVSAACDGDRDVFPLHEVFEIDIACILDDLRASFVAECLLNFLQFGDDHARGASVSDPRISI